MSGITSSLAHYRPIGENLSVRFVKPAYIPAEAKNRSGDTYEKRYYVGSEVYQDSKWANLFKSQLFDMGFLNLEDSLIAVIKHDIDDPVFNCIKQFLFLERWGITPLGMMQKVREPDFKSKGYNLITNELAIDFEEEHGSAYEGINFFALELKTGWDYEDISRIAQKYGKPGIYVLYDVGYDVNFVARASNDEVKVFDVFGYFNP